MSKKLITGLVVLLGLVALVAFIGTDNLSAQFVKSKHATKKSFHRGLDPGCPTSDAYTELCENAGGKICGPNSIGNDECCHTVEGKSTCEDKKWGFWGHYKTWKACGNQMEVGSCPE